MDGSRTHYAQRGGKPSLDQLNRTIEGLEARIQGLMSEKRQAAAARPAPDRMSGALSEIMERQKAIGSARERVARNAENRALQQPAMQTPWTETDRMSRVTPAAPVTPQPAPQNDAALREIQQTLSALRSELKRDLSDGLTRDLGIIHGEMQDLKAMAASPAAAETLRKEIALLAQSIERLEANGQSDAADLLRGEFDDLRHAFGTVAREDTLLHLGHRIEETGARLAAIDTNGLKDELVQLAWRIDDMKTGLGSLNAGPAIRALEDKLLAMASAIETLSQTVQPDRGQQQQLAGLDRRLDEISHAIAAGAHRAGEMDNAAFQRLEARIGDLVAHVDAMATSRAEPEYQIAERIEALAERIDDLSRQDSARQLEERIGHLTALIERSQQGHDEIDYGHQFEDLSRKIDDIGMHQADILVERLEMLARKIDGIEPQAHAPVHSDIDSASIGRIESRLSEIVGRLDDSVAAPASDGEALKNLERQIANLSSLMQQGGAVSAASLPDGFGDRMSAIEDYIATSDEFIVEAARQAAEAVVEAYSRNNSGGAANAADLSALSGLAEDLRTLEQHTRASEERTHDTFAALHQTLVQIAGRLDELGQPTMEVSDRAFGKSRGREAEEQIVAPQAPRQERMEPEARVHAEAEMAAPAMPKASQPEFLNEPLEAAPRRAPTNHKVDVFNESELGGVSSDVEPDAPAGTVEVQDAKAKKPSKSLIAGLAARLKPAKKEAKTAEGRMEVKQTPSLDAGDMLVEDDQSLLIEPGAGVPDVRKILEKVRAGQTAGAAPAGPSSGQHDVIAAARRAAQAAVAEASQQQAGNPARAKGKTKAKAPAAKSGDSGNRRPILLAAAAILLVVMSYPLVSNLIGGSENAPPPAELDMPESRIEAPAAAMDNSDEGLAADDQQDAAADDATAITPTPDDTAADDAADQAAPDVTEEMTLPDTTDSANMLAPAEAPFNRDGLTPADTANEQQQSEFKAPVADETQADVSNETASADAPAADVVLPAGLKPASLVEATRKGDPLAYYEIGARYTDGRDGAKVDLGEAAKWYQLAADKGLAPAQYRLASLYEKGTGVERDVARAKSLYEDAAAKGNASAMHNLAVIYATGSTGTPDFDQAAKWFTSAANLNVHDSQFNLAILYARGNGVKQDLEESYKWFAVAAQAGDQDAAQKRDEVANAMTPEQLAEAKAKASLWKPEPLVEDANTAVVPDEWLSKGNTTASIDMKRAIRNIQAILNNNGFNAGPADGEMGKKTVSAIKAFQKTVGQEETGTINDALVRELLARNKKS